MKARMILCVLAMSALVFTVSCDENKVVKPSQPSISKPNDVPSVAITNPTAEYMLIYKIIFLIPDEIGNISYDESSLDFSVTGTIGGKNINIKKTLAINKSDLYSICFVSEKNAEHYLNVHIDNIDIKTSANKGIRTNTSFDITQRNDGTIAKWDNGSKIALVCTRKIIADFRGGTSKTALSSISIDETKEILSNYVGRTIDCR